MGKATHEQECMIYEYVQTASDMNPDKGIISAVREAAENYDLDLDEMEIERIAFDIIQFNNLR